MITYGIVSIMLFCLGFFIFITDGFGIPAIRGYIGDVLVVMFLYCLVSVIWNASLIRRATTILGFAFFIECLQLTHFQTGWHLFDVVVLGSTFDLGDICMYVFGIAIIVVTDRSILCPGLLRIQPSLYLSSHSPKITS